MRIYCGIALLMMSGVVFAVEPGCMVTFSVGSASDANLPKESGFLPDGGITEGSGVSFFARGSKTGMGAVLAIGTTAPGGIQVGAVPWGGSTTKVLAHPNCFYAFGNGDITVEARYVSPEMQKMLIATKPFCISKLRVSRAYSKEFFIPEFPGPQWKPCDQ